MDLTMDQRFRVAAAADRVIYADETTFSETDAVELLTIIPSPSPWQRLRASLPSIGVSGSIPGRGFQGAAAGGLGNVKLDGEDKTFEFDSSGTRIFRAGQWRLARTETLLDSLLFGRALVQVTQIMAEAGEEQSAILLFRRGKPKKLYRSVPTTLTLGPVAVVFYFARRWKRPAKP